MQQLLNKIGNVWDRLFPDIIETDMSKDILKMATYISKNYPPERQTVLIKGVRENVLANLKHTKAEAIRVNRECDIAIKNLKK